MYCPPHVQVRKHDWQVWSIRVRMSKGMTHGGRARAPLLSFICPEYKVNCSSPAHNTAPQPPCYPMVLWPQLISGLKDPLANCSSTHSHHVGERPQNWKCLKWAYTWGNMSGSPTRPITARSKVSCLPSAWPTLLMCHGCPGMKREQTKAKRKKNALE